VSGVVPPPVIVPRKNAVGVLPSQDLHIIIIISVIMIVSVIMIISVIIISNSISSISSRGLGTHTSNFLKFSSVKRSRIMPVSKMMVSSSKWCSSVGG
jgi:cell shape-determining protein MreC